MKPKAVTLIELVILIAILAMVANILVPLLIMTRKHIIVNQELNRLEGK